jgi:hypothetical protein
MGRQHRAAPRRSDGGLGVQRMCKICSIFEEQRCSRPAIEIKRSECERVLGSMQEVSGRVRTVVTSLRCGSETRCAIQVEWTGSLVARPDRDGVNKASRLFDEAVAPRRLGKARLRFGDLESELEINSRRLSLALMSNCSPCHWSTKQRDSPALPYLCRDSCGETRGLWPPHLRISFGHAMQWFPSPCACLG